MGRAEYKPWLQIGDFSPQGHGHRIQNHITGRVHHLFSDLEVNDYYILAWADVSIDIREQYPLLPRDATECIAEKLRYPRRKSPRSQVNNVMTTDFFITVQDQVGKHLEARYVKYSSGLKKARVCEKLEIEKCYREDKGIFLKIDTRISGTQPLSEMIDWNKEIPAIIAKEAWIMQIMRKINLEPGRQSIACQPGKPTNTRDQSGETSGPTRHFIRLKKVCAKAPVSCYTTRWNTR